MAFVALVPLLWLVREARPRRGILLGLAFGAAYFGAVLYWILLFGELAWAALVSMSATFLAIFGALVPAVWRWSRPVASAVAVAALWTVLEWVRSKVPLGGFAWGEIGTTQTNTSALLPLASVAGVWGLSFVVVLVNGLLLLALERIRRRPAAALTLVAASLALVAAPALLPDAAPGGELLDVATVQVDVRPARGLGAVAEDRTIALEHADVHRSLAGDPPDLAVWGESSLDPGANDAATLEEVGAAVREVGAPTLLSTTRRGPGGGLRREAVLIGSDGAEQDSYAKVHLVPFGEYVPWRNALDWISALEQIPYDLTPGERVHPLRGAGLPSIGAVVCYESTFPDIYRHLVEQGAQLLVVVTNNASYEGTAASRQHLLMSQLRAVEEGRWVIHAAISGVSGIVDPTGRVVARAGLFEPAVLRATVRASDQRTVYSRLGDWVPLASLGIVAVMLALPRRRRWDRGAPGALPAEARTLVILPTYNERTTIAEVIRGLLARPERVDVLVVDDGSPDGTGDEVRRIAGAEPRVRLLERRTKAGLATAYLEGFRTALHEDFHLVVEMDADLSHRPEELSRLLAEVRHNDLVIGSRYVPGGSVSNWSPARMALSRAGNAYARFALGFGLRDATSGFRVFRRDLLTELVAGRIRSDGYGFQIETALRAWSAGWAIAEVPITFREREHGHSKISRRIVFEALMLVTVWGLKARLRPSPQVQGEPR